MKLVEVNWNPTQRQLRQFGGISLFALPLIAWLWGASSDIILLCAGIGAAIAITAFAIPGVIKPLFLVLMVATLPIGMVVGELAMLLIYFLVFLPVALFLRLRSRDALQLQLKKDASTYWEAKKKPKNAASYYRQS